MSPTDGSLPLGPAGRPLGRLMRTLGHHRWFAAVARLALGRVERVLFRATRGRLVPTRTVAPILLLTTTGRRTGQPRTTPVMYLRDGDRLVVSSEDFGTDRPSAWPRNLDADPRARVELPGGVALACRARRLSEAEADAYWPRLVAQWPAHATYRARSGTRHTFALEPAAADPVASTEGSTNQGGWRQAG